MEATPLCRTCAHLGGTAHMNASALDLQGYVDALSRSLLASPRLDLGSSRLDLGFCRLDLCFVRTLVGKFCFLCCESLQNHDGYCVELDLGVHLVMNQIL